MTAVLSACTSETADTRTGDVATKTTVRDVSELGGRAFADVIGDADESADSWVCQHDGIVFAWDEGRYFFRLPLGEKATDGSLEELTIDGVSYARSTAPTVPVGFEADKAAMWERAGTSWITANQPDTISLEGSPAGTAGCLSALLGLEDLSSFEHVEANPGLDVFVDNRFGVLWGVHHRDGRKLRLTLRSDTTDLATVMSWDDIPDELAIPASVDQDDVLEVSRDEFESFVG